MTRLTAVAQSGRRALRVLRPRDWVVVLGVVTVGAILASTLLLAVLDAARAREQAVRHAEAQAQVALDARRAQSDRISGLLADVAVLEDRVAAQEATIAAQSQAIADLSEQVRRAGEDPITGDPAATPDGGASAPSTSAGGTPPPPPRPGPQPPSSSPGAAPAPSPSPSPAPEPDQDDDEPGGLCLPLDLLCIG